MICDSSASGSGQPAKRGLSRKKAETAAWLGQQPGSRLVKDFAGERKRADADLAASAARVSLRRARSEERRVGKEGRARWAPDAEKKKRRDKVRFEIDVQDIF